MTDLVYSEMGQALVSSHDYLITVNDSWVTLSFPDGVTLSEKCAAIYNRWGQQGVHAFADRCYRDVIEWGTCIPCEAASPYDKSDPDTCLVCGSVARARHNNEEH